MKIDELTNFQLKIFCLSDDLKLEISFYGGRKFTATVKIGDSEQKIVASAKDVYAALRVKEREISEFEKVQSKFHDFEFKTRNRSTYSKQLNCIQKISYFVVKMFCGLSTYDDSNGAQPFTSMLKTLEEFLVKSLENKDLRRRLDNLRAMESRFERLEALYPTDNV